MTVIDSSTYIYVIVNDQQLVRVLKALADKSRFRMAQQIARAGELSCGEVGAHSGLKQPTVSHHLKILADAKIVCARREGQHAIISINREFLGDVLALLPRRFAGASGGSDTGRTRDMPRPKRAGALQQG